MMAKKADKLVALRDAVEKQAETLDPAQGEFVKAQFEHYKWNEDRIAQLEDELEAVKFDEDGFRDFKAESALFKQRHQLVAEQGQLFSHIMRWLKGTEVKEESEFEQFLAS